MHKARLKLRNDEKGFASIVIALTLIIVLSLVTLGFAQLMNNNQKAATQKQLSNQAYYAAETGVNDAVEAISKGFSGSKTQCGTQLADPNFGPNTNEVGTNGSSSYSCLLINPTPSSLLYGSINVDQPRVIEVQGINNAGSPTSISTISFSWQGTSGQPAYLPTTAACSTLPSQANWVTQSNIGILKVTIIPLTNGNTSVLTRQDLIGNQYVGYLCPSASDTASSYGSDGYNKPNANSGESTGDIVQGHCNSSNNGNIVTLPNACNVEITGLDNAFNDATTYVVVVQSLYLNNTLSMFLNGGPSGLAQLDIGQAQTVIDSTGDAQGVFKRIEARIPDHNNYPYPPDAIDGMSGICKQLALIPPTYSIDYGAGDGCNESNP